MKSSLSQFRRGVFAGAITALIISILHSQIFRQDVWGITGFIVWYLLSLFVGSASGFAVSLLLSVIPRRLPSVVEYAVGGILSLLAYYFQALIFLIIAFQTVSWE